MAIHISNSPYRSSFQPQNVRRNRTFNRIEYSGVKVMSSFFQNIKRQNKERIRFSIGPMAIIIGLGLFAAGMSTLYLMNFNKVATSGYALRRVERDHQGLVDQYQIQNMKLAELASLTHIAQTETVEGMRYPKNVVFVRGNTAVASR